MTNESDGSATKQASTFRMEYRVAVRIAANADAIWSILTNAADFPRWNSTVTSVEGEIAAGQRLALRVPLAPTRVFKPRVTVADRPRRMVWSDGAAPMFKGERTFLLTEHSDGTTEFSMSEVFTGLILPMIKGSLPDFTRAFEQYAADLRREAENRHAREAT